MRNPSMDQPVTDCYVISVTTTFKKRLKTELFTRSYAAWQRSYCILKRDLKFLFKLYVTLYNNNNNNNDNDNNKFN